MITSMKSRIEGIISEYTSAFEVKCQLESRLKDSELTEDMRLMNTKELKVINSKLLKIKKDLDESNESLESFQKSQRLITSDLETRVSMEVRHKSLPYNLPQYKGTNGFTDPEKFIRKFETVLKANQIEENRYTSALLSCLNELELEWAEINLKSDIWNENKESFLDHYINPVQMVLWNVQLQEIKMRKNENVQEYSDRFRSLVIKTNRSEANDISLPYTYLQGLNYNIKRDVNNSMNTLIIASGDIKKGLPLEMVIQTALRHESTDGYEHKGSGNFNNQRKQIICGNCEGNHLTTNCKSGSQNSDNYKNLDENRYKDDSGKKEKVCYKCNKPWKPGHKCDENLNSIIITENSPNQVKFNAINSAELIDDKLELIYSPFKINDIEMNGMIDSGANSSFISKTFVQENEMEIIPVEINIELAVDNMKVKCYGKLQAAKIENGTNVFTNDLFIVDLPTEKQLIIGLNLFYKLGYVIKGIPYKFNETKDSPAYDKPELLNINNDVPDEIKVILDENIAIGYNQRCNHPLAILSIRPTSEKPIWIPKNYVKPDYEMP